MPADIAENYERRADAHRSRRSEDARGEATRSLGEVIADWEGDKTATYAVTLTRHDGGALGKLAKPIRRWVVVQVADAGQFGSEVGIVGGLPAA